MSENLELLLLRKIEDRWIRRIKTTRRVFLKDKNGITCDDIMYMVVVSAEPKTEKGRQLVANHAQEHLEKGTDCFRASVDIFITPSEQDKREFEEKFGPCEWE